MFRGILSGGTAILAHNGEAQGAPAQITATQDGVRINPLLDGLTYCQQGWHLIALSIVGDVASFDSKKALFADLAAADIQFRLDGSSVPLEMQRTAITRVNIPAFENAFGVNFGAFLPPGSLDLGQHELETTVVLAGFPAVTETINLFVVSC